jgi:starch phosphorylase
MFSNKDEFKKIYVEKIMLTVGKSLDEASNHDKYTALSGMVRELINKKMALSNQDYLQNNVKQVFYFSLEFLLGRLLGLYLTYFGIREICREGLAELGIDLEKLEAEEPDFGLGNGGLGRLAACFLDSLSSLGIPGHGCGIRYKYGLFRQKIIEGYQVELPDNWLRNNNVWEIKKMEKAVEVRFYGRVRTDESEGRLQFIHEDYEPVLAVPYDIPIVGFQCDNVNTLRLWSAEPLMMEFDFKSFNSGNYSKAQEYKNNVEAISEVLYPDDSNYQNQVLRLKQEYFLVSASIQSIIRRFKKANQDLRAIPDKIAIHINDTHPALAIPEMLRILIDVEGFGWDEAWNLTTRTISYTNHTVMPEALEKWPVEIVSFLLPRIYEIIQEINERFCLSLWQKHPGDWRLIERMAIIAHNQVHMAHLAVVGSYSVNGVAEVHTKILKEDLMKHFYQDTPEKFSNKTNGIAHRRWLLKANLPLAGLITDAIGESWKTQPETLSKLLQLRLDEDPAFQEKFAAAKLEGKITLARYIADNYGIKLDPASIFDVQVKRIHAYKRQLLNILHILHLYNMLKTAPANDFTPRTFIFAGKAAPGYHYAKKIIKLIHSVASIINHDPAIRDRIKVVFMENYGVSQAELIFPAADISEQISTAGKEASGTGNMKFMMNGAVTIGTLDGANIEICNEVGADNIITFGLTLEEILHYYKFGGYSAYHYYASDERIKRVTDQLVNGFFAADPRDEFNDICHSLLDQNDEYFLYGDFDAFDQARNRSEKLYAQKKTWLKMAINNSASSGKFSSDATILKYAADIWKVKAKNR